MKGFTSKVLHFAFVLAQELFAKHNKTAGESGLHLCQYSTRPFPHYLSIPPWNRVAKVLRHCGGGEFVRATFFSNCKSHIRAWGGGWGHQIRCDMSDRRGGRVAPNGKRGEGQKQAMSLGFSCSESFQLTGSIHSQTQPPQPPPFTGPEKILRLPPRAPAK